MMKQIDRSTFRMCVLSGLASCLLLLGGCDVVQGEDYQKEYTPELPPAPDSPDVSVRNLLLEDYTGIRCTNCPSAAAEALALKAIYGERLVVVAIHAGSFAKPYRGYDLNTPAGTEYDAYFKIVGNPQGVICRSPYKGAAYFSPDQWAGALGALVKEAPVTLDLALNYSEETRAYDLELGIKRTADKVASQYDLLLWLVEDHIFTPQTIGGKWTPDYDQRHVFRGALNTTWGEGVTLPAKGERMALKRGAYTLPSNYEDTNCSVVAMLCDAATKEVVQVVESPPLLLPE